MRYILTLMALTCFKLSACENCDFIRQDLRHEINFLSSEISRRELDDCSYADQKYMIQRLNFFLEFQDRYFN